MTGRHSKVIDTKRRSPRLPLLAAAVLLGAALTATFFVVLTPDSKSSAAVHCKGDAKGGVLQLPVVTAPAIAGIVSDAAKQWTSEKHATADGRCVSVTVTAMASSTAENALANPNEQVPAVWIPDSSLWWQQLLSDQSELGGDSADIDVWAPIASTPVVLVTSDAKAASLANVQSGLGWNAVISGKLPVTLPDPSVNTEGMISLLNVEHEVGQGITGNALTSALLTLSRTSLDSPQQGFAKLTSDPANAPLFTATEQAVVQANRSSGGAFAIYPQEGTRVLDFTPVVFRRPTDDPARAPAAQAFQQYLHTSEVQNSLAKAGFRDGTSDPLTGAGVSQGVSPGPVTEFSAPTPADSSELIRLWTAVSTDLRTLAVIDVSGSMSEDIGGGRSRISVAQEAVQKSVSLYRPTSDVGLWAFSSDQGGKSPWAQLVSTGPIGAKYGSVTRAQALRTAINGLTARVHGGTALYDTTLAAYQHAVADYDGKQSNALIVITDGRNEDFPGSISLPTLLAKLKRLVDPDRIPIITVGIGGDADLSALRQISNETGGKSYSVHGAEDLENVFVDAFAQR